MILLSQIKKLFWNKKENKFKMFQRKLNKLIQKNLLMINNNQLEKLNRNKKLILKEI